MRILFINYEFPPIGAGGGNANAHIARCLVQMGHDVSVLTSHFKNLPHHEKRDGLHLIRIPTLRRHADKCTVFEMLIFLVSSLFFGCLWHRQIRPDVIVAFFSIPCGPAALLMRLCFGTPYLVALRGGDVPGFMPKQLGFYHAGTAWLTRLIWRHAFALTANSAGLGDLANQFYRHPHLAIIPNGVEEMFFYQKPESGVVSSVLKILTVGRLSSQKRVERLIASVSRLKQKGHEDFELTVVGDGPLRSRLAELAGRGGVLDRVKFLGWVSKEKLVHYYRAADVFGMASDFEGMPNVILEAMASGLAIVATDAAGTVELVQHGKNGFLVDRAHTELFDQFFMDLHASRDTLLRMQRRSFEFAREYTWQKVAVAYSKLCEQSRE